MKVLVSACLMGVHCRYDGTGKDIKLGEKYPHLECVSVCPEVMGGLSTPRRCAEILDGRVVDKDGKDVTKEYEEGAQKGLESALKNDCRAAILKSRSPSCGNGITYDGTFSGKLVAGNGVLAALLKKNDITVFSEENLAEFEQYLQEEKQSS